MTEVSKRVMKKYEQERDKLFPELKEKGAIWHSKTHDGWRNTPRCMTFFMTIMDDLCTGFPPSKVYLALWLRSFESYYIKDISLQSLCYECGLSGQRAETNLKNKLKKLNELGFIKHKNNFSAIALPNPYLVVKKLNEEGKVPEDKFDALIMRMCDIGEESF